MRTRAEIANMVTALHVAADGPEGTATRVVVSRDHIRQAAWLLEDLAADLHVLANDMRLTDLYVAADDVQALAKEWRVKAS